LLPRLETLKPDLGGDLSPTVVDFKVKDSPITQAGADSDPQAGLYLAGRWLEDYPAVELCFASRTRGQLRGVLARFALAASQIAACYERYGPDQPW